MMKAAASMWAFGSWVRFSKLIESITTEPMVAKAAAAKKRMFVARSLIPPILAQISESARVPPTWRVNMPSTLRL